MATNPLIKDPNALTKPINTLPMSTKDNITPVMVSVQAKPATPPPPIATTLKTSDLTKTSTPQVIDNSGVIKNIQNTLSKYTAEAGANSDFVKGAIKASGQKETPELLAQYTGKKLGDVISGLGLGEKVGYTATPIAPVATQSTTTPVATSKVETPQTTPKTAYDYINDLDTQASAMQGNIDNVYKDAGVQVKAEEVNRLSGELALLDTNQTIDNVMKNVEAQDLKDQFTDFKNDVSSTTKLGWQKGLILGQKQDEINAKLTGLSSQDVRDLATYTLNRTNLAQQVQVAQGNYNIASDIAQKSAESMKWAYDQKLELAKERRQIDDTTYERLKDQSETEYKLNTEGYVKLNDTQVESVKNDIASGKTDGTIWQDPLTKAWYKKPAVQSDLEIYAEKKAIDSLYEQGKISELDVYEAKKKIDQKYETTSKKYTADNLKAAGFAQRAEEANSIFDTLSSEVNPMLTSAISLYRNIPDRLKPSLIKQQEQAERNFVNAVLRRESGAVISEQEFDNAAKQYFPQAGDTEAVLAQKKANRETVLGNLSKESGGAYEQQFDFNALYKTLPETSRKKIETLMTSQNLTGEEAFEVLKEDLGFNSVGGDTNTATLKKLVAKEDGTKGGQCGRFVNQITGLGLGDSYQSKISKMDSSITEPAPGMVFVMPYKDTGHTGFIVSVNNDGTATVKDSNYSLDEKVKTHKIALNKITGLAKV